MPRYKGGMTRAIVITYALLYLHRIKTCFHCTRSPNSAPTEGDGECGKSTPPTTMDTASQCSLFFSVGMHYASLWLLDCCPAEKTYWSVSFPSPRLIAYLICPTSSQEALRALRSILPWCGMVSFGTPTLELSSQCHRRRLALLLFSSPSKISFCGRQNALPIGQQRNRPASFDRITSLTQ
jgi:hypothetical protein